MFSVFQTEKSVEDVKKLVRTMDKVFSVMSKNQVTGEEPAMGATNTFTFSVQKSKPRDLSNKAVSPQFTLPNIAAMFGDGLPLSDISIEVSDV